MRIKSGAKVIDNLLSGGYENDVITTFYGPAGSGKTNLSLLAAVTVAKQNKKIIYIDTEGSFSVDRFKQISNNDDSLLENFIILKPTTFNEQKRAFARLKDANFSKVGLIVVDSVAMLYRLEKGKSCEIFDVNQELGLQIGILTEVARKNNIPVIVTNQVYANFEDKDKISMVGGDILKYGSKCLVELRILNNKRMAILRKHRSIPEGKSVLFKIINEGVVGFDAVMDNGESYLAAEGSERLIPRSFERRSVRQSEKQNVGSKYEYTEPQTPAKVFVSRESDGMDNSDSDDSNNDVGSNDTSDDEIIEIKLK